MRPLTRACVLVLLVVFLSGASSRDTQSEFDALQPNSDDSGTIKRVEFPEPALIETRADLAARAKSLTVLSLTVTAVSVGCEIINFGIQVVKKLIVRHQIKSAMKEVVIAQSKLNESLLAHEAFVASLEAIEDRQLQAAKELVAYARKEKLFTGKEKQDDPFAAMFMSFYLTTGSSDVLRQKLRAIVESSTSLHGINFPKFREDVEELAKSLGDEVFNTFKEFADPSDKSAPPELLMPILKSHPALMAAYPFISPTISIAISGIKVLINLADLYATTKSCGEIVDWISSEKDVYVQDVDWNFCRLYGSLFDSVHDIDVSFDKMWREVPEAKKTDRLRALFMAFAEPLTQMKAAVMQKFAPCERFVNTQPLGSPITEMWTTRLAGAGEQAKNVSARPISVVNQPSVVKTQNVQKITNLYVYQAESTPDKFFVPGLSPEPKDLNWFGGDRIWSPIDSVAQKYEAKTARRLRPDGVAYDFDLTCKGPLGVSSMQPVLYTRRWNRRRDATTTQIQFCDTFGRAQRTAVQHSRCEQVNRASDAFKGFMEHEYHAKDNPEFTVFAPGKRFRFEFLLGLMNKPGPEPPNLFFEYERTGYRAPIVDIRDKGDAAGHNFQDGTWFPVPSIIDEYSDGCAQLRFHAFYRKDFSLPAPKGFIPSGKPKSSSADSSSSSSSSSGSKKQRN